MSLLEPTEISETEDGATLLVARNLEAWNGDQNVPIDELDAMDALWRRPDGGEWRIDSVEDGRLLLGLWRRRGPFDDVDEGTVPVEVATGKRTDVAAFLYLGLDRGRGRSREQVADLLDLAERRSVSNYLSTIRVDWPQL